MKYPNHFLLSSLPAPIIRVERGVILDSMQHPLLQRWQQIMNFSIPFSGEKFVDFGSESHEWIPIGLRLFLCFVSGEESIMVEFEEIAFDSKPSVFPDVLTLV
jgi:hypothetical protein